ncbi:unnamed protein product [Soboliphyme baturini]|uniref:Ig-like domain-containing protein n=1 Tax=Soboliphyme baturini TaxID=241478 RepID=A0A183J9M7_9BILA|nr:unnamed protein product [Soboliphyme baturini]
MGELLHIRKLNHDIDTAVYQCNVSNPLGYVFANAYINVFAHEPRFTSPVDQIIKTTIGSSVYLDCDVEAAPLAKIKWMDSKDREIGFMDSKFELMGNNTLKISEVNLLDSGLFFCLVNNKYGINRAKRKLEVYRPTYFTVILPKENIVAEAGMTIPLRCEAEKDGRLRIHYSWFKDDVDIAQKLSKDPAYKFVEQNLLHIVNVGGRHSGIYKCVAKTDVDSVETSMLLTVKDVPDSPLIIDINCDERRALVKWAAAFDNYESMEKYFVEYQTEFHPNLWTLAVVR